MARIYISATRRDLSAECDAVKDWLTNSGHKAIDSYFPSSLRTLDSCLEDIDQSDIYLLIQGHAYGEQPEQNNPEHLSYTHLEYRHARAKPRLVLRRAGIPNTRLSAFGDSDETERVLAFHAEVDRDDVRPSMFNDTEALLDQLGRGLAQELRRLGLSPGGDLRVTLQRASQELLTWPTTLPGGDWLPRPELSSLGQRIRENDRSVTLLLGEPGCGKSALLARLGLETQAAGIPVLGIKADRLPEDILGQQDLGRHLGLPAPPLATLQALTAAGPVLVLVDQLDALADLVVQRPARLRVLLELIRDLARLPNLHIVASCRAFEQHHDPNLRLIQAESLTLDLPDWEQVEVVLSNRGIQSTAWGTELKDTLRSPHALDTFLTLLTEPDEPGLLSSFQGMLQMQWERKILAFPGERKTLMLDLARRMAEEEMLSLPLAWFEARYATVRELVAAGLLRLESGRLQFRHQTLFEFVRARAFLDAQGSLTQAVLTAQDSIRIRPQLWHALHHARQASPGFYQAELARLWSPELRPHLRMLLIEFLGMQREPLPSETRLAFGQYDAPWFQRRFLNAVIGSPGWFRALAPAHLPMLMARPAAEAVLAVPILEQAIPYAEAEILAMLDRYWLPHPDKDELSWRLLVMGDAARVDAAWVDRVERIARRTELAHWAIDSAATQASAVLPEQAPRLIAAWLERRWRQERETHPALPNTSDATEASALTIPARDRPATRLLENRNLHNLPAIAEAAPRAFIEILWLLLLEMLASVAHEVHAFVVGYRGTYLLGDDLDDDKDSHIERPFLTALFGAMAAWAKAEPASYLAFAQRNADSDLLLIQRLLASGLAHCVAHAADAVLDYLCADPRRLALGTYSDHHRESKKLIRALAPCLASPQLERLERTIVDWHYYSHLPESDAATRRDRLRWEREHRLRLLRALPKELMSPPTRRLYEVEERAFPNLRDWDTHSTGARWIGSPVSAEQMAKAKDEEILGIFAELSDATAWDHPRHAMQGGSIQAGRELARMAEKDASRAVGLIKELRPGLNDGPVGEVLRALPKSVIAPDLLYTLIEELCDRGFTSAGFHHDVCYTIQDAVDKQFPLPVRMLDRLESWLADADADQAEPDQEKPRETSLLWQEGGLISLPSGNFPILMAISEACLATNPPLLNRWLDCLERHLERKESPRVWAALAQPYLINLQLVEKVRAETVVERLLQAYPEIMLRLEGIHFMAHLQRWIAPEQAYCWLAHMETLGPMAAQGAGEIVMLRRVWFPEEAWPAHKIETWLASGAEAAPQRLGLAYSVAHLWDEPSYRQLAHAYLIPLIALAEPELTPALGTLFLSRDWFPDRCTRELLDALCIHRALLRGRHAERLAERLEVLVAAEPEPVARICHALLDEWGEVLRDMSSQWYLNGDPLTAIAMALQDLGEPHRGAGVALFERMLEFNLPQAREMASSLDKRMPVNARLSRRPRRTRQGRR